MWWLNSLSDYLSSPYILKNMKIFIGIIDDYGLESFLDASNEKNQRKIFGLKLRVRMNPHRNAIFYSINISTQTENKIQEAIKQKNWIEAAKIVRQKLK